MDFKLDWAQAQTILGLGPNKADQTAQFIAIWSIDIVDFLTVKFWIIKNHNL